MWLTLQRFWKEVEGQDLTEYSLLLAFVVLASVGIFYVNAGSLTVIWRTSDIIVSQAASRSHAS
jgi:Flp pilus assembly pilin Flp